MLQILINIFRSIKMKTKRFGITYHNHFSFHYYNDLIKFSLIFLVILLCWYKRYSICLISFFNLFELFPAFVCAINIRSLTNNLSGVGFFDIFLLLLHHLVVLSLVVNQKIFHRLILFYQIILHVQTSHHIYTHQTHICTFSFIPFQHLVRYSIYQSMFLAILYIILELYHKHLLFLFCTFFCRFSLLNLFKSLKNSAKKEYFDSRERLWIFLR